MRKRFGLVAVMALLGSLLVAGVAVAQPAEFDEEEMGSGDDLVWAWDSETNTLTLESSDEQLFEELEEFEALVVEDKDGDGELSHGEVISTFSETYDGPAKGCLVSALATSGESWDEPKDNDTESDNVQISSPCPSWLIGWLFFVQGEGDDDADLDAQGEENGNGRGGPPDFVQELKEREANGEEGPPSFVERGGPRG